MKDLKKNTKIFMILIKKYVISIIVVMFSTISAFVLVEILLQLLKQDDPLQTTRNANVLRNFEFTYNLNELYKADTQFVKYYRDQYGLRDDCDDPSQIEVLTVGGSTTDQRYVNFESTYQKILQDRLRFEHKDFGCVSNAGVDGHTTWGHIFAFENWFPLIKGLSPDYVILYVGLNDVNFERTNTPNIGSDVLDSGIKTWLKQWEITTQILPLYRFIRQSIFEKSLRAQHKPKLYITEDYVESDLNKETVYLSKKNEKAFRLRFKKLINHVKNMGSTPICVSQPHRYVKSINGELRGIKNVLGEFSGLDFNHSLRAINLVMIELCGELFLDLYNQEFLPDHFYDGLHNTEKGAVFIGNLMADFFIENNILLNYPVKK